MAVARLDALVADARRAAAWWAAQPIRARAQVLLAFRDRLIDALDAVVATAQAETGKPRFDLLGECFQVCDLIGYYARRAPRYLRPRKVWPHLLLNKRAAIHYRPLGTVGIITPGNYPIVLNLSPVIQALITGNAVLLKPSERVTQTALHLARIFQTLALPAPILQLVPGGPEAAVQLAGAGLDKLVFIGGRTGALAVAAAAAQKLTPLVLELGGNDAMIVAADADLERAAHAAVWGAFFNAGQSCIAVERCYVVAAVADRFIERVAALTRSLAWRPLPTAVPEANSTDGDLGPLSSAEHCRRIAALVAEALEQGACAVVGGPAARAEGDETRYPPTVLTGVDHTMRILREEVFGPVLPIMRVADWDEAIARANDSPLGLSASIWTADQRRARATAARLEVGGVVINDCLLHFAIAELPFGGVKGSGFGRLQGREGLLEFCATQTVSRHWFGPRREFHWFPTRGKERWLGRALRSFFRRWRSIGRRGQPYEPYDLPG